MTNYRIILTPDYFHIYDGDELVAEGRWWIDEVAGKINYHYRYNSQKIKSHQVEETLVCEIYRRNNGKEPSDVIKGIIALAVRHPRLFRLLSFQAERKQKKIVKVVEAYQRGEISREEAVKRLDKLLGCVR